MAPWWQISFGTMIGCDNEDCKYEWFHTECLQRIGIDVDTVRVSLSLRRFYPLVLSYLIRSMLHAAAPRPVGMPVLLERQGGRCGGHSRRPRCRRCPPATARCFQRAACEGGACGGGCRAQVMTTAAYCCGVLVALRWRVFFFSCVLCSKGAMHFVCYTRGPRQSHTQKIAAYLYSSRVCYSAAPLTPFLSLSFSFSLACETTAPTAPATSAYLPRPKTREQQLRAADNERCCAQRWRRSQSRCSPRWRCGGCATTTTSQVPAAFFAQRSDRCLQPAA